MFLVVPPPPSPPARLSESAVFLAEDGRVLRAFLNGDDQWLLPWPDGVPVPANLGTAVIESEDRYFFYHPGVNPPAMVRAFVQNARAGEIVSGASTLTMQLARIFDPKPRTVWSKIVESIQALRFELRYSKQEILRRYLTYAPYGGNVIGAPAASWKYFGKSVDALTWAEAALLAVLPRSPGSVYPSREGSNLKVVRDRILRTLGDRGVIGGAMLQHSLSEELPDFARPFPFEAPHFTRYLYEDLRLQSGTVRTTIDLDLQQELERTAAVHANYLNSLGIENLAIVVAETGSGRIRAYIGSQDYFDTEHSGAVDGVLAARSSGSILKPFLYGLSIDDGILLPDTMIMDIPTHFGTFKPQNVGFAYFGIISAAEALQRSLNVPAVRLLAEYGHRDFYLFLQNAGVTTLFRRPDDYGLTLIIGGAEIRLLDLVSLYRGLGRGGIFGPLVVCENPLMETVGNQRGASVSLRHSSLMSRGGALLVLDMLRGLTRPNEEVWWERQSGSFPLAWKTGTSYGNRDAWAAGVSPDWTIGVWVGNFNGEENVNLKSTTTSAPLLFDIFSLLPKQTRWFDVPEGTFRTDTICLDTGYLAGDDCERTAQVNVPVRAKPLPVCPYHRRVYLNKEKTYEVCSHCWDEDAVSESRLFFPPDVVQYLSDRGTLVEALPPHNPECPVLGTGISPGRNLSIVYPDNHAVIYLPRDLSGVSQQITLRAAHRSPGERVFWYLDGDYSGETSTAHVLSLGLDRGTHKLLLVDERGERVSVEFTVLVQPDR